MALWTLEGRLDYKRLDLQRLVQLRLYLGRLDLGRLDPRRPTKLIKIFHQLLL